MGELWAGALAWADVDPDRHPFAMDDPAARELTRHCRGRVGGGIGAGLLGAADGAPDWGRP